jgi:transmembrane protein EpsG
VNGGEKKLAVYLGIIFVILILSLTLDNQNSESVLIEQKGFMLTSYKMVIFLISCILIFFAGVRYQVGADYSQYASNFFAYCTQELKWNGEPGIRIVARIASKFYNDYRMMFILMSVITVGAATLTIAKHSPYYSISILLYVFLGAWHESFNSVRQSAAAAILFLGHKYIKERKLAKWLIVCAIAFMFHTSAIVFVPLYFLPYKKITIKKLSVFVVVGIVAGFSYDRVWDWISLLQGKTYIMDLYSTSSISFFRIIVAWIPILFYMLFFYRNQSEDEIDSSMNLYASISVLSAAIILAARYSTYLGRIVIYTDIYNSLFWAHMLSRFPKGDRNTRLWILIILGCYFVYYLNEASGIYLVNYQWIFGK